MKNYPHNPRQNMHAFIPASARKVVDIGCNTGAFGEGLKNTRSIEVWGVEPNANAAKLASQRLDNVIVSLFDADVPLPDATFDVVIFNDVLEHFAEPWNALRIAARKLRPGGCVVASIPNLRQIDNLIHILKDKDFHYETMGIRDRTHLRFFTRKSILRLFEESGYRVEILEGINEEWWTSSIWRRFGFRIFKDFLEDTKYIQFAVVAFPE